MLIIDKGTRRICFVTEDESRCLHVLYSPVSHDYVEAKVQEEVARQPWHYLWSGTAVPANLADFGPYALKAERASLLLQVAAVVRRCRRLVSVDNEEQSIYDAKLNEANAVANGDTSSAPFLKQAAEFHNVSLQDEATAVLFRHRQRHTVLLSTEDWRQRMVHRVLVAPLSSFEELRVEVQRYATALPDH